MLDLLVFDFCAEESKRTGVLIDVPERESLENIETLLHTKYRPRLTPADLILLRFPPWEMRDPEPRNESENAGIERIVERFPHASVRVIASQDYRHLVGRELSRHAKSDLGIDSDSTDFLKNLRNCELWKMARDSNALMSSDQSYVFRLPSKELSDQFLRVGNVQTRRHNLDTFFFWMIPYLKNAHGLVVDTWSIGSLALNCGLRLKSYDKRRSHDLNIELQGEYIDGRLVTRDEVRRLAKEASNEFQHPLLFLFSASMTGRSIRHTYSGLVSGDCPRELLRLLVLFRVGREKILVEGEEVPELCAPPPDQFGQHLPADLPNRTTIEINRSTYFPTFIEEREVRLYKKFAQRHRVFFDKYMQSNSIRIHADSKVGGQTYRHHGIFIDVNSLLSQKAFKKGLESKLQELDNSPRAIIAPPHEAGESLARFAAEYFLERRGAKPTVVIHLDLGLLGEFEADGEGGHAAKGLSRFHTELMDFSRSDSILVLDDVVTTGTRLRTYQKRLRDLNYKGAIDYLVGVQRMESEDRWKDLVSTLGHNSNGRNHTLRFVEEVTLPNWDEESCPLCVEKALLLELKKDEKKGLEPWLSDRLNVLQRSRENGLSKGVFFVRRNRKMELGPSSVFVSEGAPESVVLSSVAAAIQELRNEESPGQRLDPSGFPVRSVLSAKDFNRYTDAILWASILRSLSVAEIRHGSTTAESELIKIVKSAFHSTAEEEVSLQPELALAIGMGKVSDRAADTLHHRPNKDEECKAMIRIIGAQKA